MSFPIAALSIFVVLYGCWRLAVWIAAGARSRSRTTWSIGARAVAAVPDSSGWLSVGYSDARIRFFDRRQRAEVQGKPSVEVGPQGFGLAAMDVQFADLRRILAASGGMRELVIYDVTHAGVRPPRRLKRLVTQASVCAVCIAPDTSFLAFGEEDGYVCRWDWREKDEPQVLKSPHPLQRIHSLTIHPTGERLAVACAEGVSQWNPWTGAYLGTLDHRQPQCVRFSPDGRMLAIAGSGVIALTSADDGAHIRSMDHPDVFSIAFSPDSAILASVGAGGVRLWHAASGNPHCPPVEDPSIVHAHFFGRSTLVVIDSRGTVREERVPAETQVLPQPVTAPAITAARPFMEAIEVRDALAVEHAVVRERPKKREIPERVRVEGARVLLALAVSVAVAFYLTLPAPRPEPKEPWGKVQWGKTRWEQMAMDPLRVFQAPPPPEKPLPKLMPPAEVTKRAELLMRRAREDRQVGDRAASNRQYARAGYIIETVRQSVQDYAKAAETAAGENLAAPPPAGQAPSLFENSGRASDEVRPDVAEYAKSDANGRMELMLAQILKVFENQMRVEIEKAVKAAMSERKEESDLDESAIFVNLEEAGLEAARPPGADPDHVAVDELKERTATMQKALSASVKTVLAKYAGVKVPDRSGKLKPLREIVKAEFKDQYRAYAAALAKEKSRKKAALAAKRPSGQKRTAKSRPAD